MASEVFRYGRMLAVGRNTFREAIRTRVFVGLMCFAVAFMLFSLVLSELVVVGQGPRVVVDFGFFAISLFAASTGIVMGALLVYKEIEKKTLYTILSKPIQRYEFIIGKYLGMVTILAGEVIALGLVWALVIMTQGGEVALLHIKGMVLILMECCLVAAVTVMFSSMTSPVLTALFGLGVFTVGRVVFIVEEMLNASRGIFVDSEIARLFGVGVTAVFPDLSVFNISQQMIMNAPVDWSYVGHGILYAAGYVTLCLVVAILAFQRRDFI